MNVSAITPGFSAANPVKITTTEENQVPKKTRKTDYKKLAIAGAAITAAVIAGIMLKRKFGGGAEKLTQRNLNNSEVSENIRNSEIFERTYRRISLERTSNIDLSQIPDPNSLKIPNSDFTRIQSSNNTRKTLPGLIDDSEQKNAVKRKFLSRKYRRHNNTSVAPNLNISPEIPVSQVMQLKNFERVPGKS